MCQGGKTNNELLFTTSIFKNLFIKAHFVLWIWPWTNFVIWIWPWTSKQAATYAYTIRCKNTKSNDSNSDRHLQSDDRSVDHMYKIRAFGWEATSEIMGFEVWILELFVHTHSLTRKHSCLEFDSWQPFASSWYKVDSVFKAGIQGLEFKF